MLRRTLLQAVLAVVLCASTVTFGALTSAQLTALKAHITASGDLNTEPMNGDGHFNIAAKMNLTAVPDYFIWRSSVSRTEIYNTTGDASSTWNWATYKSQSVTEQGTWREIFMGDLAPFNRLNTRVGVKEIFSGSAAQNTQRDHVLSIGRRTATRAEKLFGVAVISPPANTGNNTGTARGTTTNPDEPGFEGNITPSDVQQARNLP